MFIIEKNQITGFIDLVIQFFIVYLYVFSDKSVWYKYGIIICSEVDS